MPLKGLHAYLASSERGEQRRIQIPARVLFQAEYVTERQKRNRYNIGRVAHISSFFEATNN